MQVGLIHPLSVASMSLMSYLSHPAQLSHSLEESGRFCSTCLAVCVSSTPVGMCSLFIRALVCMCVCECGSSRFLEGRAVLSFRGERRPRWHLSLRARPLSPSSLPPSLAMQSPLTEPRNYKHRRMSSTPALSVFQDVLISLSFRSLLSLCSGKCTSKSLLCSCLWLGQV